MGNKSSARSHTVEELTAIVHEAMWVIEQRFKKLEARIKDMELDINDLRSLIGSSAKTAQEMQQKLEDAAVGMGEHTKDDDNVGDLDARVLALEKTLQENNPQEGIPPFIGCAAVSSSTSWSSSGSYSSSSSSATSTISPDEGKPEARKSGAENVTTICGLSACAHIKKKEEPVVEKEREATFAPMMESDVDEKPFKNEAKPDKKVSEGAEETTGDVISVENLMSEGRHLSSRVVPEEDIEKHASGEEPEEHLRTEKGRPLTEVGPKEFGKIDDDEFSGIPVLERSEKSYDPIVERSSSIHSGKSLHRRSFMQPGGDLDLRVRNRTTIEEPAESLVSQKELSDTIGLSPTQPSVASWDATSGTILNEAIDRVNKNSAQKVAGNEDLKRKGAGKRRNSFSEAQLPIIESSETFRNTETNALHNSSSQSSIETISKTSRPGDMDPTDKLVTEKKRMPSQMLDANHEKCKAVEFSKSNYSETFPSVTGKELRHKYFDSSSGVWDKKEGITPLQRAVRHGDTKKVHELLGSGYNTDEKDVAGNTVLHWAARLGHLDIVEELMLHGADVDSRGAAGWTPLHFAAAHGNAAIVEVMVTNGADINAKDHKGNTAMQLAAFQSQASVIRIFRRYGSDKTENDDYGPSEYQIQLRNRIEDSERMKKSKKKEKKDKEKKMKESKTQIEEQKRRKVSEQKEMGTKENTREREVQKPAKHSEEKEMETEEYNREREVRHHTKGSVQKKGGEKKTKGGSGSAKERDDASERVIETWLSG